MQPISTAAILCISIIATNAAPQYGPPSSATGHSCHTEYTTIWNTQYVETEHQECRTIVVNQCTTAVRPDCRNVPRQVCTTVQLPPPPPPPPRCTTVYNDVCTTRYRNERERYTETECATSRQQDCEYRWEGEGNTKVWAPIPGTCRTNPVQKCGDVQKWREVRVPYEECAKVPVQKCVDVPQQPPQVKQECNTVNEQVCRQVEYPQCSAVPKQSCETVHKKVPQRVSRRVPKKVCGHGSNGGGSGFNDGGSASNNVEDVIIDVRKAAVKKDAVNFQ